MCKSLIKLNWIRCCRKLHGNDHFFQYRSAIVRICFQVLHIGVMHYKNFVRANTSVSNLFATPGGCSDAVKSLKENYEEIKHCLRYFSSNKDEKPLKWSQAAD